MQDRVLMVDRPARLSARLPNVSGSKDAWWIVGMLGWALALIGWTDVVLTWFPFRPGDPEWEFGTVSATFAGMPLATIGLSAAAGSVMARGSRRTLRALAILFWLIFTSVGLSYALYLLAVPLAWRGIDEPLRPTLTQAIIKTSVFAATYLILYACLGWFAWRRSRAATNRA